MSLPLKAIFLSAALTAAMVSPLLSGEVDDFVKGAAAFSKSDYATAVHFFTKAIEHDQKKSAALLARGFCYEKLDEFDKAIADFDVVIRLDPKSALALVCRGNAQLAKGKVDRAIADYGEAIHLDPNSAGAYYGRGFALHENGEIEKAIDDFDEAIRCNPKHVSAHIYRGISFGVNNEFDKALSDFDEAIRLDSKSSEALNNRAWVRSTCPDANFRDGTKAIDDATKACELTDWKSPDLLDTLGAAFAEAGQFDKAVEWQQKAVELAPESEKADFGTRLKLYQEGKPSLITAPSEKVARWHWAAS